MNDQTQHTQHTVYDLKQILYLRHGPIIIQLILSKTPDSEICLSGSWALGTQPRIDTIAIPLAHEHRIVVCRKTQKAWLESMEGGQSWQRCNWLPDSGRLPDRAYQYIIEHIESRMP